MTTKRVDTAVVIFLFFGLIFLMGGCATQHEPMAGDGQSQNDQLVAIDAISSTATEDETVVTIAADGPLTFSSFKKPDPPAVVLIFPATTVSRLPANPELDSDLIQKVIVGQGNGGQTARVEFQLTADAAYTATQQGDKVSLTFSQPADSAMEKATQTSTSMMARAPEQAVETPVANAAPEASPTVSASATGKSSVIVPKTTAWVNKVDFLSESEGKSTLVLGTNHAVEYRIIKVNPKKIEIQLLNTRIPAYRQRALITTRFNSAVDRVVPYQVSKKKNETMVSIEMREAVPYYAEQADNLLLVHFEPSAVPPKPMEQAQLPAWKQTLSGSMADSEVPRQATGGMETPVMKTMPEEKLTSSVPGTSDTYEDAGVKDDLELMAALNPRRKNYTGEKIALDFFDTDIKNVFRILREVSGKNFAIDKDVTGKVTMTIDKPVPWDQILDLVLRMNQLGKTYEGDIVRIATLETLKREDDLRKAKLQALKESREEAKALEPLVTKYIAVSYSNAEKEIKPHIEKILTKSRGNVSIDAKNNQVIITDTMAKVLQAEDIVRRIDKVTSQVIIEARVVEVSTDFTRELGIDWNVTHGTTGAGNIANTTMAMNFPSPSATSSIGVQFSRLSGVPHIIDAQINALETTGEGRILSSPKILTLDNKKAKIKQGLEYPYLERDSSGGASIKFKNIDLLLEVTPHVTPDNRISMAIYLTKNDVDSLVGGVPALSTNEAETELLVNDGDTVVIGGIIKSSEREASAGFPGLSRIPLLGWLFKNNQDTRESNELLIFITPRIVQLEQDMANIVK